MDHLPWQRKGFVVPVGVEILLDPLGMFIIIDLVENRRNIVKIIDGVLGSIRPQFLSWAHASKLEHHLIVVNVAVRKILPEVDDEEVGDESSNDGSLGFCPNGTG